MENSKMIKVGIGDKERREKTKGNETFTKMEKVMEKALLQRGGGKKASIDEGQRD